MSDDAPRSTQGNRPDQRRGRGAPAWWDMLQRSDLPDDPHGADRVVDTAGWAVPTTFPGTRARRGRLRMFASVLAAVLIAAAVAVAVWTVTAAWGRSVAMTAAVIVAVPVALLVVSLAGSLAGRRRRRG